eukprot:1970747-Prymnesium_polylepis.2
MCPVFGHLSLERGRRPACGTGNRIPHTDTRATASARGSGAPPSVFLPHVPHVPHACRARGAETTRG